MSDISSYDSSSEEICDQQQVEVCEPPTKRIKRDTKVSNLNCIEVVQLLCQIFSLFKTGEECISFLFGCLPSLTRNIKIIVSEILMKIISEHRQSNDTSPSSYRTIISRLTPDIGHIISSHSVNIKTLKKVLSDIIDKSTEEKKSANSSSYASNILSPIASTSMSSTIAIDTTDHADVSITTGFDKELENLTFPEFSTRPMSQDVPIFSSIYSKKPIGSSSSRWLQKPEPFYMHCQFFKTSQMKDLPNKDRYLSKVREIKMFVNFEDMSNPAYRSIREMVYNTQKHLDDSVSSGKITLIKKDEHS